MEIYPLGLVLGSAFMHVLWNILVKSSRDKLVFMGWGFLFSALFYFPLFLMNLGKSPIPPLGWTLIWISGFIHVVYTITLTKAYDKGDLSLVYPLARSAPLFVTLWAVFFLKERLTMGGFLGILFVVVGAYIIGLRALAWRELIKPVFSLKDKPYQLALLTALLVSLYSIVDKVGVQHVYPFTFYYLMLLTRLVLYVPFVFKTRHTSVVPEWKRNKKNILLIGIIQFLSYLLILYAMTLTKVSYIVAIRQISAVFGVLAGTALLKEKYGLVRFVASSFIFLGIFLIGLKG
jgi:drug/metabolite transporter (DMT)-like permease